MPQFYKDANGSDTEAPCEADQFLPVLPQFELPADPKLAAEGWQRRFIADGIRLKEYLELYTSLGYEVHTEMVQPEEIGPECTDCRLVVCRQFVTLYTRKR